MGTRFQQLLACLLVLHCGFAASAEEGQAEFALRVDISAAQAVLDVFDSAPPSKEAIAALLDHPAVRATITQTSRFDTAATDEAYADSLWQVVNGKTPEADPLNFVGVRDRLPDIRKMLSALTAQQSTIAEQIADRLRQYTPPQTDVDSTMFAVLGGTSDGWAPGDGKFYIAVHYFRDDVPGLTAMVTHEMYHIVQQAFFFQEETDEEQESAADALLTNLIAEGTATLVGDPSQFEGDGRYLQFLKRKHARNLARMRDNVALFEALYFRAMNDPQVRIDQLYNLGFSGGWDSPLYFVGFKIAQGLESHLGREALVDLLAHKSPAQIVARYVRLVTETEDPELVTFSPTIEAYFNETRD